MKKQKMKGFNLLTLAQYNALPEQDKKQYFNLVRGLDIYASKADLQNYYTKSEIDQMINIGLKVEVVAELPTEDIRTDTIYLVPKAGEGNNNHYEYIFLESIQDWEKIGKTDIDLSNYYNKSETDTKLDEKLDKQQDIADAGKVFGVGEDGIVELVEQSGGGSSDTLKYGGAFTHDGTFIQDSVTPYTQELANTNIKDIDRVKYNNYYFNSMGEGKIVIGTQQGYKEVSGEPLDLGTPSEAYEYIFTDVYGTPGAVLSFYNYVNEDTGAMIYPDGVIPSPEDIMESSAFYVIIENIDPTLTTILYVYQNDVDHINRTIEIIYCTTVNVELGTIDDFLDLSKDFIYIIKDGDITSVQKGTSISKETYFVGIIDGSGNITESMNSLFGFVGNLDNIYMNRGSLGNVYVQASESGSTTIEDYNLRHYFTYDLGDYIFIGSDGDIRVIKPVIGGGGGSDAYALKERHKVTFFYNELPGLQSEYEIIDGEFIGDGWVNNVDLEVGKNYYQALNENAYNIFEIISNDTVAEEIVVAREQWVKNLKEWLWTNYL